ncbi:MAG TPA: hypothetical protein DEP88_03930 [Verrucomicrobiales bacterium]|nr:hypothetical protein [Verrucomicrobiales bacterium]
MPETFRNTHTNKDMQQLRHLLSQAIGNGIGNQPVSLLNLACGRADETRVLADVFGKNGIQISGMDIRDRELDIARERWKKLLPDNAEAEFHVQNGTKLSTLKQLRDDFDVVFMRHQNYWNGDTTWKEIYDQALHRLDEDGMMVITSYFDREHNQALEAIQSLGAKLVTNIRNPDSRILLDAKGKSVDRHIAVFSKL